MSWEFPEEDPLSETGYEEVDPQIIGPGFYFYGLHRLPQLKKYSFENHEVGITFSDSFDEDRIVQTNYSSKFSLADGSSRNIAVLARFHGSCPFGIYIDAFGKSVSEAFTEKIESLRDEIAQYPPDNDFWNTMSSTIFERELNNILSKVLMETVSFSFGHYGMNLFSFELKTTGTK